MMNLQRFTDAQEGIYHTAVQELKSGRKKSHWMWFVFPQLQGLGRSTTAQFYGIQHRAEAEAYLAHPVLGPRLREVTGVLLTLPVPDAHAVFGSPDDLKLKSCLTLFAAVARERPNGFRQALEVFFGGAEDPLTLQMLGKNEGH